VLAAAGLALFSALGAWQLERAAAKQRLLEAFESRRLGPELLLEGGPLAAGAAASAAALRYRPARARGRYLTARQYLLDNRTRRGRAGYEVLTALRIAPDRALLVNRGWVPLGRSRERLPELPLPSGVVEVRGELAPAAPPVPVLGETGYGRGSWPRVIERVELDRMAAELGVGLLPVALLLDPGAPDGFVREWDPRARLSPDRHRAYALQWFTFAGLVPILYLAARRRGGRR